MEDKPAKPLPENRLGGWLPRPTKTVWYSIAFLLFGIALGFVANLQVQLHIGLSAAERARRFLEIGYFIAGLILPILAAFGLYQLKLTRDGLKQTQELAQTSENREALRLAIEQCLFYAQKVSPAQDEVARRVLTAQSGKFAHIVLNPNLAQPPCKVSKGTIQLSYELNLEHAAKLMDELRPIDFMNLLEGFAIPFAANMANDDVGYFETGTAFLQLAQTYMPCFQFLRAAQQARFMAVTSLYEHWQLRYTKEHLTFIRDSIDRQIPR